MKNRIPITLTAQDRSRLEMLAAAKDVSLSEAVRRAVIAEYERMQEEEVRARILDPVRAELEQVRTKILELEPQVVGTAVRLLALINCSKGRPGIEAEIARLVQP